MACLYWDNIVPNNGLNMEMLKSVDRSKLDALVVSFEPFFPKNSKSVLSYFINEGIPVFIITGQRGMYEQQESRKKEKQIIDAGGISLSACNTNIPEIVREINNIFDRKDTGLIMKIAKVQEKFYRPAIEASEMSKMLEFLVDGGSIDLGKFVYTDYSKWMHVKSSQNYKPLSDACFDSFVGARESIIREMSDNKIQNYYSMGPSPDVDKKILEAFVLDRKKINYHPIDISPFSISNSVRAVSDYLGKVDGSWREYINIIHENPTLFNELCISSPSCLAYQGGQIANDNSFLSSAAKICGKKGMVVADIHTRKQENDANFWKNIYDIKEEKEMFKRALDFILPDLKDKDGWDIVVKYVEGSPNRISFQLDIYKEIETYAAIGVKIKLKPGVKRELMISKKYLPQEFYTETSNNNFSIASENVVPVSIEGGETKGNVTTAILNYAA